MSNGDKRRELLNDNGVLGDINSRVGIRMS